MGPPRQTRRAQREEQRQRTAAEQKRGVSAVNATRSCAPYLYVFPDYRTRQQDPTLPVTGLGTGGALLEAGTTRFRPRSTSVTSS